MGAIKNFPRGESVNMSAAAAGLTAGLTAYLIGSIPFGLLVARYLFGVDVRKVGSGNIGATNVARVIGARAGAMALILDVLKGAVPVLVVPRILVGSDSDVYLHLQVLCASAAVLGHMFPVWLQFRGGKGVATAMGAVVVVSPVAALGAAVAFFATFGMYRIVSASSMLAALGFCLVQLWLLRPNPFSSDTWSLAAFSLAVPALIIVRHRTNLKRLLRGEEPRFRAGKKNDRPDRDGTAQSEGPT